MIRLPRPLFAFDYTTRIPPDTLKAYGVEVVVRYLSRDSWKVITRPEAQELKAAGIGVALVFEDSAVNALMGEAQGRADAEWALNEANDVFGGDTGGQITFAVDYDTAGNAAATDPYFDGVAAVLTRKRGGPYGGFEVVNRQADRGFQALYQTYAWSGAQLDTRARIYQYSNDHPIGPGVDFDHVFFADYGQWTGRPKPPDPYAIFPTSIDKFGDERALVERVDRLLRDPEANRGVLKGKLWYELKRFRDRIWRVARYEPPEFSRRRARPDWLEFDRGRRWQELNSRMKRIAAL